MKMKGLVALSLLCALLVGAAGARELQSVSVDWRVIGSGGRHLEHGATSVSNTLGRPVVGRYTSGNIAQCVGFWCRVLVRYKVYVPLVLKTDGG